MKATIAPKGTTLVTRTEDWLRAAIRGAREEVEIVSPWIAEVPVKQVLKRLTAGVRLRVVFRWPRDRGDAGPLEWAAVAALLAAATTASDDKVVIEYVLGPLHAKVYRADSRALVTSANLTSAGISQNIELGSVVEASQELRTWLAGLPTYRLDAAAAQVLRSGLEATPDQAKRQPFPQPSTGRVAFAGGVFDAVGIPHRHIPEGCGQNAWEAPLFRRSAAVVKAQTSCANAHGKYHFKVDRRLDTLLSSGVVHGIALVPYKLENGGYRSPPDTPAVVLISAQALYAEGGLGRGALRGHDSLSVYLERGRKGWVLRIPNAGGRGGRVAEAPLRRDSHRGKKVLRLRPEDWKRR
jgi:hypothetical protein